MNYKEEYNKWLSFDEATKAELSAITDEKEIEDRFYKNLEFGTGGLRGIMGAGANRMNKYTVSKATKGLADYLNNEFGGKKSVAVAYDSRNNSKLFASYVAEVLAANGIKTYLFDSLKPTPVLSFTVKYLNCNAGVVVTASHNPKEYNGYKVYDSTGCQLIPELANKVISYVNAVEHIEKVEHMSLEEAKEKGLLEYIGDEVLEAFLNEVRKQTLYTETNNLKVVYTPLHGSGNIPVRKILKDFDVTVVKEQENPDGNFSTVRSPNPEEKDALTLGIEKAKEIGADIVVGTDPDCDRIGTAVLHNGEYVLITGNQMGALLADFVLSQKKASLNSRSTLVTTIVTNDLGAKIAESYGLKVVRTLTGFKFICNQVNEFKKNNNADNEFVMGYEESYGYLVGTHAMDKDAVVSSYLACQMAAYHKGRGKTLVDALNELYDEFGYFLDYLDPFVLKGIDGSQKIKSIMSELRENGNKIFDGVESVIDYSLGVGNIPKDNVLKFMFKSGSWLAARPSGTEPKIKFYYLICEPSKEQANETLEKLRSIVKSIVEG